MTYARARLWLGICGVGSLVTLCAVLIVTRVPHRLLSNETAFSLNDVSQLSLVTLFFIAWLTPLDYLGGYRLPKSYRKRFTSFRFWIRNYLKAVLGQALLFISFASAILMAGRSLSLTGSVLVVCLGMVVCFVLRNRLMSSRQVDSKWTTDKFVDAISLVQSWNIYVPQTIIVRHKDPGFTGGIIGTGRFTKIVIPEAWLKVMSREELATAIARRAVAFNSGSYARGLAFAFAWNLVGFMISTFAPGAGLTSVAEIVTTFCGFTLWSFLGLLTLPTVSRNASLQVDSILGQHGTPSNLIWNTAYSLDQMQDGEPHRPKLIETIFHPVPSVTSRTCREPKPTLGAWNVARTSLFLSWACYGMLSRAVHCNVGRPELWTMLPTD